MRTILFILLTNMIIGAVNAGSLPQFHSHKDILNTVETFLAANLQRSRDIETKTRISPLDARLTLARCEVPLSAFSSTDINQNARFSVGVKCGGQKPWSLYVTVKVEKIATLYIASTPISRGDVILEDNIQLVKRDINKLRHGFFVNKRELIGMVAKRSIRAGTIFSQRHLSPPLIIKKGDSVDIIAKTPAILIRMSGKAMSDGAKGQRIKVKNSSSKKIIDAIVMEAGLVSVRI